MDRIELVKLAESQWHVPYDMRAWKPAELYLNKPKDFDCSSFVMWLYFRFGYKIPRVSADQYAYCKKIADNEREIGDLWFRKKKGRIFHVGLYIGSGMLMHAAGGKAGKVVRDFENKIQAKVGWAGYGKVPLDRAEDDFFRWIKKHPKPKK